MSDATRTEEPQPANRIGTTTPEQLTGEELEGIVGGVIGDGGCPTAMAYPDLGSPEDKSEPVSNK